MCRKEFNHDPVMTEQEHESWFEEMERIHELLNQYKIGDLMAFGTMWYMRNIIVYEAGRPAKSSEGRSSGKSF